MSFRVHVSRRSSNLDTSSSTARLHAQKHPSHPATKSRLKFPTPSPAKSSHKTSRSMSFTKTKTSLSSTNPQDSLSTLPPETPTALSSTPSFIIAKGNSPASAESSDPVSSIDSIKTPPAASSQPKPTAPNNHSSHSSLNAKRASSTSPPCNLHLRKNRTPSSPTSVATQSRDKKWRS